MKKNFDVNFKSENFETSNRLLKEQYSVSCRICHSVISREKLISPCLCKGSLAFVHLSCLERWLNQSGRDTCELCTFRFEAEQTRRYSIYQGLRIWYRHPRHSSQLKADLVISLVLSGVTLGLCSICLGGMKYFVIEGFRVGISYVWTEGVISFFLTVIVVGYITTIYLMLRDHLVPWYHWWNRCVNVRLILDMDMIPAVEQHSFQVSSSDTLAHTSRLNITSLKTDQENVLQNNANQSTVIFIPEITSTGALPTTNVMRNTSIPSVMSAVMSHIFRSIDTAAMVAVHQPTKFGNDNIEDDSHVDLRNVAVPVPKSNEPQLSQPTIVHQPSPTETINVITSQSSQASVRNSNPVINNDKI